MNTYNYGSSNKISNNRNNCGCSNNTPNFNYCCMNNTPNSTKNPSSNLSNNCINPLAACFFTLPPSQFALVSALLGILLLDNLNINQQNQLGNFLVGTGQTLLTAAAQGAALQDQSSQNDAVRQQLEIIKNHIRDLEQELDK